MELLLTVEQVARQLQVTPHTVREHLKSGRLRGIRHGRLWRVPESALFESTKRTAKANEARATSPLAAAMRQSEALRDELQTGTRGPLDAANDVEANRTARLPELEGATL